MIATAAPREPWLEKHFSTIIGVLIAIVTIAGAFVGWRSALAGGAAGNEDDAGIIAALAAQESSTLSEIRANQHRTNYLDYWTNRQIVDLMASDGTLDNIPPDQEMEVLREITEAADLATANKRFFPSQYLTADGSYNAERERAESMAEAAQERDLNAVQHFDAANQWRDKSLALMVVLVLLGISLWLLASAETVAHRAKYVLALGGLLFLLIGVGAAVAVESDAALADVYGIGSLLSYVVAALVLVGLVVAVVTGRGRAASRAEAGDDGDSPAEARFKQFAILLIATVALLGAVVAYLQADASNRGDAAIRRAQLQAAEALGAQTTGESRANFQYGGAAQTWEELRVLANAATEAGDARAAARYTELRESLAEFSEILRPPYFDGAEGGAPDLARYESEQYVARAAALSEASALGGALENAWEEKSNTYIIHLTLLATALALLGLSLTFSGVVRPLFLAVGSGLVAVTLVWVGLTYAREISDVPQQAVDAYGRGVGAAYRGDAPAAIAAFDESLAAAPGYGTALYARGGVHAEAGDLEAALRDYEAARGAGKDTANVSWDIGYTNYLLGNFDNAIAAYNRALAADPRMVWVRLDLAIAYLAQSRVQEAEAEYARAREQMAAQVAEAKAAGREAPPSLLYYLDAGADDLEGLVSTLDPTEKPKPGAPGKDKIADVATVLKAAEDQFVALKSLSVALEYTGKPPTGTVEAVVSPFEFGVPAGDGLERSETFPSDSKDIWVIYDYEGMRDGQQVIMKVYVDGEEWPEYRSALTWDQGASGEFSRAITDDFAYGSSYFFDPGEYTVELYVDSQLVQRGWFTVEEDTP